ncbi:DUF2972 domain-containing protein [Helicobacter apodemus]|uniref:DUF2972 domain-containing protein n=1 Tax=Helicobacter apodemus TaxID=135569 RepID=A0A2U8FGC7_9HELI|nr:DUF2972 domain-containing protein [Helicobacter apodemus]AWI34847.1 hypothetical protein CDV25_08780 [Helicobacter apodemus]
MLVLSQHLGGRDSHKFCSLLQTKTIIAMTRDPFSVFKSAINHWDSEFNKRMLHNLNLTYEIKNLFGVTYLNSNGKSVDKPDITRLNSMVSGACSSNTLRIFIENGFFPYYLDVLNLYPNVLVSSARKLADDFGWNLDENSISSLTKQNFRGKFYPNLPRCLIAHYDDLKKTTKNDPQSLTKEGGIKIHISDSALANPSFLDITKDLFPKDFLEFLNEDIMFFVKTQSDKMALMQHKMLLEITRDYLKEFVKVLKETTIRQNKYLVSESDEIYYVCQSRQLRKDLKNAINKNCAHLKMNRPDILKSWKYYQEFLRICKEVD